MPEPHQPVTELSSFSSPGSVAIEWSHAQKRLRDAAIYWISTVRPDGRPHVTPLLGVLLAGRLHFCTGPNERKAKNLGHNPHCILTTGDNGLEGLDIVVEGQCTSLTNDAQLALVADAYEAKYGERLTSPSGTWFGLSDSIRHADPDTLLVFQVDPATAFGFSKGTHFSQTTWRFP